MEESLHSKMVGNNPRYYVKWTGYNEPTWQPAEYDADSAEVKIFHEQYPQNMDLENSNPSQEQAYWTEGYFHRLIITCWSFLSRYVACLLTCLLSSVALLSKKISQLYLVRC